jgi:hypothetical protein
MAGKEDQFDDETLGDEFNLGDEGGDEGEEFGMEDAEGLDEENDSAKLDQIKSAVENLESEFESLKGLVGLGDEETDLSTEGDNDLGELTDGGEGDGGMEALGGEFGGDDFGDEGSDEGEGDEGDEGEGNDDEEDENKPFGESVDYDKYFESYVAAASKEGGDTGATKVDGALKNLKSAPKVTAGTPTQTGTTGGPAEKFGTAAKHATKDVPAGKETKLADKGQKAVGKAGGTGGPAESQSTATKHTKVTAPVDDEQDSFEKSGVKLLDALPSKLVTREGFMAQASKLFDESFDGSFRNAAAKQKAPAKK